MHRLKIVRKTNMDRSESSPTQKTKHVSSPTQDQTNDEDIEEITPPASEEETASGEETGSQSPNPFELINDKTSSGLKKLRGSLNSLRKVTVSEFVRETRKHAGKTSSSSSKHADYVVPSERCQREGQLSGQTESPNSLDLTSDLSRVKPQSLNKTASPVKELHRGRQSDATSPKQGDSKTLHIKSLVLDNDYLGQNEDTPQSQGSTTLSIKRLSTPTPLPPSIPPPVPPRRPKDHRIEQEVRQHQGKKQAELPTASIPPSEVSQANPVIEPQSHRADEQSIAKSVPLPFSDRKADLNTSIGIVIDPNVNTDAVQYPDIRKLCKESYLTRPTKPELNNSDVHKGLGEDERSRDGPAANPAQNEGNFHPKTSPAFKSKMIRDPLSPPILTVHKIFRPNMHQQILSPVKQDAVEESQKCPYPNPNRSPQQTRSTVDNLGRPLESNKSVRQMEHFPQPEAVSRKIAKLYSHPQNYAEEDMEEHIHVRQTSPYQTAPQRPAPKPPSVRSTVVQYPGPLKGYTAPSAPSWDEAHPPPLPPPPPPRNLAPTYPVDPPRYMYYDRSEPRPYMPTTEPIPKQSGGLPFLNNIRLWRESFTRKTRSSTEQPKPSAMPSLGGLMPSASWKTRLFSRTSRGQFSSLSTATSSLDSPGSPVDTKKPSGVWIFQPSAPQSNESIEDTRRKRKRDSISECLLGEDIYKICVIQTACCCCWPVGLASRILASTVYRNRRQPSEAFIHTMAAYQTWYSLLLGISFYFFFLVVIISLLIVKGG